MEHSKQHFIPQTYLKSWCDKEKPENYNDYVWVFDCNGENPKKKSPKNIFYEKDLYTIYDNGKRILDIEHGLSGLENAFSNIRDAKIEKKKKLSKEERLILLAFVAAMHNRLPVIKEHIAKFWGEVIEIAVDLQNATNPIGHLEDGNENTHSFTVHDAELCYTKPFETFLLPRINIELELYSQMHLCILTTKDEIGFITSDNPVFWFSKIESNLPAARRGVGLGYKDVEVTLPISPSAAIFISHKDTPIYFGVDMSIVDSINYRTRLNSEEYFVVNKCYKKDVWFE